MAKFLPEHFCCLDVLQNQNIKKLKAAKTNRKRFFSFHSNCQILHGHLAFNARHGGRALTRGGCLHKEIRWVIFICIGISLFLNVLAEVKYVVIFQFQVFQIPTNGPCVNIIGFFPHFPNGYTLISCFRSLTINLPVMMMIIFVLGEKVCSSSWKEFRSI